MTAPHSQPDLTARLAEIRERCEKATPGPWTREVGGTACIGVPSPPAAWTLLAQVYGTNHAANETFIAAAREDVPWLLAEVTALRERIEAVEALCEREEKKMPKCGVGDCECWVAVDVDDVRAAIRGAAAEEGT
jgi:hypothetical protein